MLGGRRCRVNQLVRARPRAASPASIVGASRSIRGRVGRAAGKGLQEEFGGVGHLRERSCSRAAASQTSRSVHGAIEADRSREPVQETRSSLGSAPYATVSQFRQRATAPHVDTSRSELLLAAAGALAESRFVGSRRTSCRRATILACGPGWSAHHCSTGLSTARRTGSSLGVKAGECFSLTSGRAVPCAGGR
jgi:hypothetical protein